MPNYDGTGPFGDGRPGRGLGPCGRNYNRRNENAGYGRGNLNGNQGHRCRRHLIDYVLPLFQGISEGFRLNKTNLKEIKSELVKELDWINKELEQTGKE
jgi:hypothetical protein